MKILDVYEHYRTLGGERIKAVRIMLQGGITDAEIEALKNEHGCSEEIEHMLVLSNPAAEMAEGKDDQIAKLMAERDELVSQVNLMSKSKQKI